jgi:hypothetical protein
MFASGASSLVVSPQPSFDSGDGTNFTALPVKILHGIKRSKAALRSTSNVDLTIQDGRGRSSSNVSKPPHIERPSLETNPSSQSRRSRLSMYSTTSINEGGGGERTPRGKDMVEEVGNKELHVETSEVAVRKGHNLTAKLWPHSEPASVAKGMERKSECVVQ